MTLYGSFKCKQEWVFANSFMVDSSTYVARKPEERKSIIKNANIIFILMMFKTLNKFNVGKPYLGCVFNTKLVHEQYKGALLTSAVVTKKLFVLFLYKIPKSKQ